jgi:hypothetical protein
LKDILVFIELFSCLFCQLQQANQGDIELSDDLKFLPEELLRADNDHLILRVAISRPATEE